jgi:hypothetical protein
VFNPYEPPQEVPPPRPASAEVLASCTVLVTVPRKRSQRIADRMRMWLYPLLAGLTGFTMASAAGFAVQLGVALTCGSVVSIVVMLASKRHALRRKLAYRFYDDGFDIEAEGLLARIDWTKVHAFDEVPDGLILHSGSVQRFPIHRFPSHGLPKDGVAALRALFASKVASSSNEK